MVHHRIDQKVSRNSDVVELLLQAHNQSKSRPKSKTMLLIRRIIRQKIHFFKTFVW